ncbi:acyltransferase family protein [Hymenobacter caeli]|uniref:Peptidoglycan/LPS O-acetylase OafA/YrhL n=1 Tax=Hymenobacter caeli TaxID=2735894 RepID=A0ABX2FU21_9BACT|nr:acyltransferase [Hymenobacter caeli]NRT20467.1 peptidoglycan/LPS O-acetylase OafA/YrhL [Hymenobacter caeli]
MKKHYEILDGLRGTAALLVVVFHLFEGLNPDYRTNPLHHGYLAVDFFFLLSGFVVGYAYDDRWPALRLRDFLRLRLVRLHPMVLVAVAIGALGYVLDPWASAVQRTSGLRMTAALALGALLLPGPTLPNRFDETHPLNGPCWSLLQEYLANLAYALVGPRLGPRALAAVVAVAAAALVATAVRHGHLQGGWGRSTFWMAPVRVAFPFSAGLLLFRRGWRIRLPGAYGWLSLALLALFAGPTWQPAGYYEAFCVVAVFPLVVAAGAGAYAAGRLGPLCRWAGRISYPLYLVHYPFIYIFTNWVNATHPTRAHALPVMGALVVFFVGLAWVVLRLYDEPVRAWLGARFRRRPPVPA